MEVVGVVSFCVITFLCQVRFDLLGHRFLTNYFSLLLIIVLFNYNKDIKSRKCAEIISSYIYAFYSQVFSCAFAEDLASKVDRRAGRQFPKSKTI